MPGPPLRALVADHHDVAGHDVAAQDRLDGRLLRLEDPGRAAEGQAVLGDAGGLDHRAVEREVAVQDRQAAVGRVRVRDVADAAVGGVGVQATPSGCRWRTARWCVRRRVPRGTARAPARWPGRRGCPSRPATRRRVGACTAGTSRLQQPGPVEFAEDGRDAAGPVHVLHVVLRRVRRDLGQARHPAARSRRCRRRGSRARPRARRPAGAAPCSWIRPWRRRARPRSRTRPGTRWPAAARCRHLRRTKQYRDPSLDSLETSTHSGSMNYDFSSLPHSEFEDLARDLVGREIDLRFEAFPAGPDDGIDGRHARADGSIVMQAKHYHGSGFAALKSKMAKERLSIDRLAATRYILVTSAALTPKNKNALAQIIGPSLQTPGDIFGPGDLNALLRKYPDIEKAHQKLWAQSTSVLETVVTEAVGKAMSKPRGGSRSSCQSPSACGGCRECSACRESRARHHISDQGIACRR